VLTPQQLLGFLQNAAQHLVDLWRARHRLAELVEALEAQVPVGQRRVRAVGDDQSRRGAGQEPGALRGRRQAGDGDEREGHHDRGGRLAAHGVPQHAQRAQAAVVGGNDQPDGDRGQGVGDCGGSVGGEPAGRTGAVPPSGDDVEHSQGDAGLGGDQHEVEAGLERRRPAQDGEHERRAGEPAEHEGDRRREEHPQDQRKLAQRDGLGLALRLDVQHHGLGHREGERERPPGQREPGKERLAGQQAVSGHDSHGEERAGDGEHDERLARDAGTAKAHREPPRSVGTGLMSGRLECPAGMSAGWGAD
jgi:hypothetical protein